jgi:putative protease
MENARMTAFHTEKPSRLINSENGSKNVQDALLYPETRPDFSANISNRMARKFYLEHGVTETVPGFEAAGYAKKHASSCLPENSIEITSGRQELFLMHSRHCILKDNGLCLKNSSSRNPEFYITHRNLRFRIRTDCPRCEMYLEPADSNRHD